MDSMQKMTLIRAINYHGVENQTKQALQEMGELIVELERRGTDRWDRDHAAEEIADCIIMMEQLRIIYGSDMVDFWIDKKIDRLEERLNT